jgi:hypothetical protein
MSALRLTGGARATDGVFVSLAPVRSPIMGKQNHASEASADHFVRD